jgi:hypothetical protein
VVLKVLEISHIGGPCEGSFYTKRWHKWVFMFEPSIGLHDLYGKTQFLKIVVLH